MQHAVSPEQDSALANSQGAVKVHANSLEPTAPLTSDWSVAKVEEHQAQIGIVQYAVFI